MTSDDIINQLAQTLPPDVYMHLAGIGGTIVLNRTRSRTRMVKDILRGLEACGIGFTGTVRTKTPFTTHWVVLTNGMVVRAKPGNHFRAIISVVAKSELDADVIAYNKAREQVDRRNALVESAKKKLTPEERAALGLK